MTAEAIPVPNPKPEALGNLSKPESGETAARRSFLMPPGSRTPIYEITSDTQLLFDAGSSAGAVFAINPEGEIKHHFYDPGLSGAAGSEGEEPSGDVGNEPFTMGRGWKFILFSKLESSHSGFEFQTEGPDDLTTQHVAKEDKESGPLRETIKEFEKITKITNNNPDMNLPRVVGFKTAKS